MELHQCTLRRWRRGDEASLIQHANNRKVWINLRDVFPHPYTRADADAWIQRSESESPQTSFAIEVGGSAVGGIGLTLQSDIFRRSAEVGFWLGEEYWGRGIMTEALKAVSEYAFANFDLCRIFAGVFETNPASMRVLEKAGYILEGRLMKAVTKEHRTLDQLMYAMTR
jgi:RimJ/RimL family protein N-acetyltransferase